MAEGGRLGKSNTLSMSLPDVSSVYHPVSLRESQLSPLPDTPFLSSDKPETNYNIDDDAWADKADPVTGSVFYIEPSTSSATSIVPSSSSSSLSSSPPVSEHSPTPYTSLPERFSNNMQFPVSQSLEEYDKPSPDAPFHWEKPPSLRRKLKKMVGVSAIKKRGRKQHLHSESLSDLNQLHSEHTPLSDGAPQIPQGSQIGSHGTPLHTPTSSPLLGYQMKVELDLAHFQLGLGTEGGVCSLEKLGIVPARMLGGGKFGSLASLRFSFKTHYPPLPASPAQPVVVRGIVPGYPAAGTQLKTGDTIIAVNHHHVNLDNIDSVLATLTCKVSFLVRKQRHAHTAANHTPSTLLSSPPPVPTPHMGSSGGLVRLVTGGRGTCLPGPRKQQRHLHMLLYITLDTKEDDPPEKDILFQYPRLSKERGEDEGGGPENLEELVKLRGVFLTLSDMLGVMTGSLSVSNSSVLVDGKLLHVSCSQKGKLLLLIALPAELVSQYQLQLLLEVVEKTMTLMFTSVQNAFTVASHSPAVEHLMSLLFDQLLSDSPVTMSSPLLGLPAIPKLKFYLDVSIKLDAVLSGLEAADHTDRPEMLHMRRPFLLLGSCLIYRGALACSHLSPAEQRGVAIFCHAYRLLELTASESVSQIVIWQEIFLSSVADNKKRTSTSCQPSPRTFLLVVGLEQTLLCMLMQQLHSAPGQQLHQSPSVDAVYVDRGRALLLELRAQDLLSADSLDITSLPSVSSADVALSSLFRRSSSKPLLHSVSQHNSPVVGRSRKLSDPFSVKLGRMGQGSDSEEEEEGGLGGRGAFERRSHSMLHLKTSFRKRKPKFASSSSVELTSRKPSGKIPHPLAPYTLTSGQENLLLHYVDLQPGRGLMLCPTHTTPPGCIHSELLKGFQQTCCAVRQLLRGSGVEGEGGVESDSESDDDWGSEDEEEHGGVQEVLPRPFAPKASSVIEHGVMLECSTNSLKTVASLHYWVIGRYYPETNRELYVCCQENVSQSTVEMVFKLLFGWPG